MKLFCVRHGETDFNALGRIQGQLDSQLSELGWRQCRSVAAFFAGQPIDAIISSPLSRALNSAQVIAERLGLEVLVEPRLVEINAGVFQGRAWPDIDAHFPAEAVQWRSQDPDFRIPEGESRRDLMVRSGEAFCAIREAGYRQAIVVAHGGSLSAAFKELLDIPARHNPFALFNGSISTVVWDKDFKLLTLNETAHLRDEQSGNGDL